MQSTCLCIARQFDRLQDKLQVMADPATKMKADVPTQIFEEFCAELTAGGFPPELIARLQKTLIGDCKFSEAALRAAILSDDQPAP